MSARALLPYMLVLACTHATPSPSPVPAQQLSATPAPAPTPPTLALASHVATTPADDAGAPVPATPAVDAGAARLPDGTAIASCEDAPANMSCIPGGAMIRGTDDGPENTRPAATVHLQTFYMDRFEVTIAEYKACVRAGACPKGGPFYPDFSRPHQPIVGMTWRGAKAFCEAHGKQLPTEAQWEKAARGDAGALHPWGDERPSCRRAVIKDKRGRSCGTPMARSSEPYKGRTFVVGSRPAAAYGLYDMVGNAWEYVADWYAPDYASCGDACMGVDPKGPCGGVEPCPGHDQKLVKGGSWYWSGQLGNGAIRRAQPPDNRPFHHYGFRCAASLEQAAALRGKPLAAEAPREGEPNPDRERGL